MEETYENRGELTLRDLNYLENETTYMESDVIVHRIINPITCVESDTDSYGNVEPLRGRAVSLHVYAPPKYVPKFYD